ncbi:MAG TPA: RDD family protein, partial [Chloroflexia bacterium]|nr:RDD family protein [Chloroflexia bacterium]
MASDASRLAQVFIWKEGRPPDIKYAREVLCAVNPETARSIAGENPPLRLFAVEDPWPDEPWERAIADMRNLEAPGSTSWIDTSLYDLTGWQGRDSTTGDRLFTVTAYRRAAPAPSFVGSGMSAPRQVSPAVPQVPYYPQFPTGPVEWPPSDAQASPPAGSVGYAHQRDPLVTSPLGPGGQAGQPQNPAPSGPPTSYAPYYASFGARLAAALIDVFFMMLLQIGTVAALVWRSLASETGPDDYFFRDYGLLACLGFAIFGLYHLVQVSIWGQTIGKKLAGIKIVRADGGSPGAAQALLRMLGYVFSAAVAGWGFFMVALDPRRQGLHDKIAETYVIPERVPAQVPAGLPGYGPLPPTLLKPQPAPSPLAAGTPVVGMAVVGNPQVHTIGQVGGAPDYIMQDLSATSYVQLEPEEVVSSPEGEGLYDRNTDPQLDSYEIEIHGSNSHASGSSALPFKTTGPVTDMNIEATRLHTDVLSRSEKARSL